MARSDRGKLLTKLSLLRPTVQEGTVPRRKLIYLAASTLGESSPQLEIAALANSINN